jgi:hypothetical protein
MGRTIVRLSEVTMDRQLTVSRSVLAGVLNHMYPDPEAVGPLGPYGPVVRRSVERAGPLPDPWLGAAAAGALIRHVLGQQELAVSLGAAERGNELARTSIQRFVADFCGTPPRPHWPFPWPPPPWWAQGEVRPVDVLVAGAQFHRVAETMPDNVLAAEFDAGADELFAVGLRQLDG